MCKVIFRMGTDKNLYFILPNFRPRNFFSPNQLVLTRSSMVMGGDGFAEKSFSPAAPPRPADR